MSPILFRFQVLGSIVGCMFIFGWIFKKTQKQNSNDTELASSSSPSSSSTAAASYSGTRNYDVFLSFRGEIRRRFLSHLYHALEEKYITTFIDENLEKGEDLQALLQKIQESAISIVIFSEDFAGSTWCLDEVVKIEECMTNWGQRVLPVFYDVDPSNVTEDAGTYAAAIEKHKEIAKRKMDKETMDKVPKWRPALQKIANIDGWDSKVVGPEAILVREIVKNVTEKLKEMFPYQPSLKYIGIDSRIQQISSLLRIESDDVYIVGIWGMGGLGKTTIAEAVFEKHSRKFYACKFLGKVRENSKMKGIDNLRKELYNGLLGDDIDKSFVREKLRYKKVFIVLDDVDDPLHLDNLLLDGHDSFGSGSKIIVTSRNLQVLKWRTDEQHELGELSDNESLQLFCLTAFKQREPPPNRVKQTSKVLSYCQNNPLALKVMGSSLYGKEDRDWESALKGLGKGPQEGIHNVLKVSYDGLGGEEKNIFLDIACFFRGLDRDYVTNILDSYSVSAYYKTSVLIDKCLISTSDNNLEIHDLLQEMAWNIVREEPERSRFWEWEDICKVLEEKKGTRAIEGIALPYYQGGDDLHIQSDTFTGLDNLRLLKIVSNHGLKFDRIEVPPFLPKALKYLHWREFPFKSLPSTLKAKELVMLILPYSRIKKLWTGEQQVDLPSLKRLELQFSVSLTEIPDLSKSKKIEYIDLAGCASLVNLPPSLGDLKHLQHLDLCLCTSLETLPSSFSSQGLRFLNLSFCLKVKKCPEIFGNLEELNLRQSPIEDLSSSITGLKSLRVLNIIVPSKAIPKLPPSIQELHLADHMIEKSPQYLQEVKSLRDLRFTLYDLELSIKNEDALNYYRSVEFLPSGIFGLNSLRTLKFLHCPSLVSFAEIAEPIEGFTDLTLTDLTVRGCAAFERLPNNMFYLKSLKKLKITGAAIKELPSSIEQLCCLQSLIVQECEELITLSSGIHKLIQCTTISIDHCTGLCSLSELPPSLEQLSAIGCQSLVTISNRSKCCLAIARFPQSLLLEENACKFIADNAQRNIQLLATKAQNEKIQISYVYPGNEIPPVLSNRSEGRSVTMQLPSNWHEYKGIAFCVVVAFRNPPDCVSSSGIECACRDNRNDIICRWQFMGNIEGYPSRDQVVLWYDPHLKKKYLEGVSVNEGSSMSKYSGCMVSFKFRTYKTSERVGVVKECAVHLV